VLSGYLILSGAALSTALKGLFRTASAAEGTSGLETQRTTAASCRPEGLLHPLTTRQWAAVTECRAYVRIRRASAPAATTSMKAADPMPLKSPTLRCDTTAPTK
jgi:hypothetical protein